LICGNCDLLGATFDIAPHRLADNARARRVLTYALRRMQSSGRRAELNSDLMKQIIEADLLPKPAEQADNLIRWIGDNAAGADPFGPVLQNPGALAAIIGAWNVGSAGTVFGTLRTDGLLKEIAPPDGRIGLLLTMEGWERYEELKRTHSEGRIAFMAMKFGDAGLDHVYETCFKPAVKDAGFELRRIDEQPRAGLIDDQLRVDIRKSRFAVVDLSHANAGAYWEAGFAEGLGKPVIYTCSREAFDHPRLRPHFDTNHHLMVIWSADNVAIAGERLKATIRATLPSEAKLTDEAASPA
jgi:hypothetical protein